MSDYWVKASEISSYVYCRRSWWLKRKQGATSQNVRELYRGEQHHEKHGRLVWQAQWGKRVAYALLFIFVAFVTFQMLLSTTN